jgi:hypothetical protein
MTPGYNDAVFFSFLNSFRNLKGLISLLRYNDRLNIFFVGFNFLSTLLVPSNLKSREDEEVNIFEEKKGMCRRTNLNLNKV